MKVSQLKTLMQRIKCNGYEISIVQHPDLKGHPWIMVQRQVVCVKTQKLVWVSTYKSFNNLLFEMTIPEVLNTVKEALYTLTRHEIDEQFTFDDKQVTNPHPPKKNK